MQKVVWDEDVIRFRENPLVRYLLDAGPFSLNTLASLPGISTADREQFAQLIGYSVSGFGDLSYTQDKTVAKADKRASKLIEQKRVDELERQKEATERGENPNTGKGLVNRINDEAARGAAAREQEKK